MNTNYLSANKHRTLAALLAVVVTMLACNSSSGLPTATLPPVPVNISWSSGPVLALLSGGGCPDSCYRMVFSAPPELVLYADGRQIIYDGHHLTERQLSRPEMCSLLSDIEQTGYFTYDPKQYLQEFSQIRRGSVGYYFVGVYAWKSNDMLLPGIVGLLESKDDKGAESILPVVAAYRRLTAYDASTFKPYQPEQLAVFIQKQTDRMYNGPNYQPPPWKLTLPSLADMERRFTATKSKDHGDEIIVSKSEAQAIFEMFEQDPSSGLQYFKEGNEEYGIAIRALLPYETTGGSVNDRPHIPSPGAQFTPVRLSCPK